MCEPDPPVSDMTTLAENPAPLLRVPDEEEERERRRVLRFEVVEGMTDAVGRSPLTRACAEGKLDRVRELVEGPAACDVNAPDEEGRLAVYEACERGHLGVLAYLLSRPGIAPLKLPKALSYALSFRNPEQAATVREVLAAVPAEATAVLNDLVPDMVTAQLDAVSVMLDDPRVDFSSPGSGCGWGSVLMDAAINNRDGLTRVLLAHPRIREAGLVNRVGFGGLTPWQAALLYGCVKVVPLLLADPACDLNLPGPNGEGPLELAVSGCRAQSVLLVLESQRVENPRGQEAARLVGMLAERGLEQVVAAWAEVDPDLDVTPALDPGLADSDPVLHDRLIAHHRRWADRLPPSGKQ